jgi:hypothetical protein
MTRRFQLFLEARVSMASVLTLYCKVRAIRLVLMATYALKHSWPRMTVRGITSRCLVYCVNLPFCRCNRNHGLQAHRFCSTLGTYFKCYGTGIQRLMISLIDRHDRCCAGHLLEHKVSGPAMHVVDR